MRYKEEIITNWDVLFVIGVLVFFAYETMSFSQDARRFPLFFLFLGIAVLTVEFFLRLSSNKLLEKIHNQLDGITGDMSIELDEEDEESDDDHEDSLITDETRRIVFLSGLLVGLGLVTHLVGIFVGLVLFNVAMIYALGPQNLLRTVVASGLILILVYGIFGVLIGVSMF